jgi:hypothetical protein
MTWTDLLTREMEVTYATTLKLVGKVDPESLDWKPATGTNWMTVGQLLKHMSEGCGAGCKAFLTGDWGLPPGVKIEDLKPEEMLPPAEKLPTIGSADEARRLIEADRPVALQMLGQAGEEKLSGLRMAAPWEPGREHELGWHFQQMVRHLDRHKAQLFYYLKLQGAAVNTGDLWG